MAARAKKRAAYGLLALVAVNVVSSALSQGADTVSWLAAARTEGSARYLPSQKGQLHQGRAQIVHLHGCETRLRTTPINCTYDGRAITWGFASSDEMCIAYFAVTVPASRSNLDAQSLAARGLPGPEGCKVQSFP